MYMALTMLQYMRGVGFYRQPHSRRKFRIQEISTTTLATIMYSASTLDR